jgi:hypothetical protein
MDSGGMFQGIIEKNQVHGLVAFIVLLQDLREKAIHKLQP